MYGWPRREPPPPSQRNRPCKYFQRGLCRYGSRCWYRHVRPDNSISFFSREREIFEECPKQFANACSKVLCRLRHPEYKFHQPCTDPDRCIDKLPADMIRLLCLNVGERPRDFLAFASTCKSIRDAAIHPALIKNLTCEIRSLDKITKIKSFTQRTRDLLRRLSIQEVFDGVLDKAAIILAESTNAFQNVQELKMKSYSATWKPERLQLQVVRFLQKNGASLQKLDIDSIRDTSILSDVALHCPNLTELEVANCVASPGIHVLSKLPALKSLTIQLNLKNASDQLSEALRLVFSQCPLETLVLKEVSDDQLKSDLVCLFDPEALLLLRSLAELRVSFDSPINDLFFVAVAKLSNLKTLSIEWTGTSNTANSSPRILDDIFEGCRKLESLDLQRVKMDTLSLKRIYNRLPDLMRFSIRTHPHLYFEFSIQQLLDRRVTYRNSSNAKPGRKDLPEKLEETPEDAMEPEEDPTLILAHLGRYMGPYYIDSSSSDDDDDDDLHRGYTARYQYH